MNLSSERELVNTQKKLGAVERLYAQALADTDGNLEVREAELESLQQQIKQLKEDIARYKARHTVRH